MRGFKLRLLSCGAARRSVRVARHLGWACRLQPAGRGRAPTRPPARKEGQGQGGEGGPLRRGRQPPLRAALRARRQEATRRPRATTSTFKEPPYNTICPLLQNILDSKSDSFFDVKYKVGETTRVNRISVKTEANRIIAAFHKEGLEFYQQLYGATAAALLDDAIKANYDIAMLADLSQRYFHTKAGAEGDHPARHALPRARQLPRSRLRVRRTAAAQGRRRLLTAADAVQGVPRVQAQRRPAARRNVPRPPRAAPQGREGQDGIVVGRKTYTLDMLRAELDRPIELMQASATRRRVGDARRQPGSRRGRGRRPAVPRPDLPRTMFYSRRRRGPTTGSRANWTSCSPATADDATAACRCRATFPVTTSDLLIFRGYDGVYGVATRDRVVERPRRPRRRRRCGVSKTTAGLHQLVTSGEHRRHRHEAGRAGLVGHVLQPAGERLQHPVREPADRAARARRAERLLRGRRRDHRRRRCSPTRTSASTPARSSARAATSPTWSAPAGSSRST